MIIGRRHGSGWDMYILVLTGCYPRSCEEGRENVWYDLQSLAM